MKVAFEAGAFDSQAQQQCDQIGRFLKFAYKSIPKRLVTFGPFRNRSVYVKTAVTIIQATFGNIWANFLLQHLFILLNSYPRSNILSIDFNVICIQDSLKYQLASFTLSFQSQNCKLYFDFFTDLVKFSEHLLSTSNSVVNQLYPHSHPSGCYNKAANASGPIPHANTRSISYIQSFNCNGKCLSLFVALVGLPFLAFTLYSVLQL